ncbi:MAG: PIN domain-containing protein [Candidatus Pacearchaeota archaeon]
MIILDTNFLIYLLKYKIAHQLEELKHELAVPSQVIYELEKISVKGNMKDREAAKLVLTLLDKWHIRILEAEGNADEAIEFLAKKEGAKVATMDKLLTRKLKKLGIKIIKIRQKKHFIEY